MAGSRVAGIDGLIDWAKSVYIFGFFADEKASTRADRCPIYYTVMGHNECPYENACALDESQ